MEEYSDDTIEFLMKLETSHDSYLDTKKYNSVAEFLKSLGVTDFSEDIVESGIESDIKSDLDICFNELFGANSAKNFRWSYGSLFDENEQNLIDCIDVLMECKSVNKYQDLHYAVHFVFSQMKYYNYYFEDAIKYVVKPFIEYRKAKSGSVQISTDSSNAISSNVDSSNVDSSNADSSLYKRFKNIKRITKEVDNFNGDDFEKFCASLLKSNGFKKITVTQYIGDFGVDIIAYRNNLKYVIQCKRLNIKSKVGVKAIQEVYSGKDFYDADVAIVLTNSSFTPNAMVMGNKLGVELWDRGVLNSLLNN